MRKIVFCYFLLASSLINSQTLKIINQDYDKAKEIARKENKMLLIDFWTTWCAPCKVLDKQVFQNDSIQKILDENFVLLKYNAEDDTFNLSKKHHVNSYPTVIVLNENSKVVSRKYGFGGSKPNELIKNVMEFIEESKELNKNNFFIKGYDSKIDMSNYPEFYKSYWSGKKIKDADEKVLNYLKSNPDIFSEEYFSVVVIFAKNLPKDGKIPQEFLNNRKKYISLFGETDVNVALVFFSFEKFEDAISNKSENQFKQAKEYIYSALGEETGKKMTNMFQSRFDKAIRG